MQQSTKVLLILIGLCSYKRENETTARSQVPNRLCFLDQKCSACFSVINWAKIKILNKTFNIKVYRCTLKQNKTKSGTELGTLKLVFYHQNIIPRNSRTNLCRQFCFAGIIFLSERIPLNYLSAWPSLASQLLLAFCVFMDKGKLPEGRGWMTALHNGDSFASIQFTQLLQYNNRTLLIREIMCLEKSFNLRTHTHTIAEIFVPFVKINTSNWR